MELFFLAILILTMVAALGSGYPVAFALPGSAIFAIALAGVCGLIFAGDSGAYFAQGSPVQWFNAGVTNFRGIYWEPERDTLIAIPLFIFMGIMLERSKIAEDLLLTMAQLFGPVPGGLGISVVVVGALLAATTGILGATVVAMGLISLPVMLRNGYSRSLATGTISASGTLGQIIPPSIVLIILADQLSNAIDQGATLRKAEYKLGTGISSLPAEFGLTSASAGDMFLGAFLPGLVLVGLYVLYILVLALIRPKVAPAVPHEGKFDARFWGRVFVVLVPPLTLIVAVLGSIILGIATVNQAGAIGAAGALIMAGYRLKEGQKRAFVPAIMAVIALTMIVVLINTYELNVKNIRNQEDATGIALAAAAVGLLTISIVWSGWRAFRIEKTLHWVMTETAKTTSLVFIILLGAAMLTAAFRAFGGEDLVRHFLSGLPGGFYGKFIVVMAVIFLLGFFLDFIEIAVVVVPIIAPILLADPSANITAVWLGVMIGVNMQTSFLTPPFGFALFYLRGVAPPEVRTIEI
ncbi:MAG: TRAP transporter large permease, partial [Hyphomicrobiales bacterium]